jgi:uncharacterized membrane protein YbhN (UPF0104 family)
MTKKQLLRRSATFVVLLVTIGAAVYYLINHRSLLTHLAHISPWVVVSVLLLYTVLFGVLLLVLDATLRLCRIRIGKQENVILNAYTLIINNFFIIGQNGPIFRGYYLKTRHNLKVRNYLAVTLFYFLIYGVVSVFFIFLGSQAWWLSLIAGLLMIGTAAMMVRFYVRRKKYNPEEFSISPRGVAYIMLATFLQVIIQAIIYGVELHNSGQAHIAIRQVITYTGTANLALFVALTPGAIGIRESFLLLSQHLHHISSGAIVVANVIDRSVYLVFLLILLAVTLSLHAKDRLMSHKATKNTPANEPVKDS